MDVVGPSCYEELEAPSASFLMLGIAKGDVVTNDCGGSQMKGRAQAQDTYLCEVVVPRLLS